MLLYLLKEISASTFAVSRNTTVAQLESFPHQDISIFQSLFFHFITALSGQIPRQSQRFASPVFHLPNAPPLLTPNPFQAENGAR